MAKAKRINLSTRVLYFFSSNFHPFNPFPYCNGKRLCKGETSRAEAEEKVLGAMAPATSEEIETAEKVGFLNLKGSPFFIKKSSKKVWSNFFE